MDGGVVELCFLGPAVGDSSGEEEIRGGGEMGRREEGRKRGVEEKGRKRGEVERR